MVILESKIAQCLNHNSILYNTLPDAIIIVVINNMLDLPLVLDLGRCAGINRVLDCSLGKMR